MKFVAYCVSNIVRIAKIAALTIVIVELGAIWSEVHQMRSEQVKNALYALPSENRIKIQGKPAEQRLKSTSFVRGDVEIDGEVEVAQPLQVDIDR